MNDFGEWSRGYREFLSLFVDRVEPTSELSKIAKWEQHETMSRVLSAEEGRRREFFISLTESQKAVYLEVVQDAVEAAFHDVLAEISWYLGEEGDSDSDSGVFKVIWHDEVIHGELNFDFHVLLNLRKEST